MKILNKKEFYKMPVGTLFSSYEPCIIDGLKVKEETIYNSDKEPIDFFYRDFIGNVECSGSSEFFDILDNAEKNSTEFELDYNCGERDGIFDDDDMYIVYDSQTLHHFSKAIDSCVGYDVAGSACG